MPAFSTQSKGARKLTTSKLTLDISSPSEFPSLSGGHQQSQPATPGQAIWANASQRTGQQAISQRQPQAPGTTQPPSRISQSQPQSQSQSHDDLFPSANQFASQLDDYRNGGQGISGQLSGGSQPQPSSIEEFPPLGRNAPTDIGQERRGNTLQTAGYGSYGGGLGFSGLNQNSQSRSLMGNAVNGQSDSSRIMSPTAAGSGGELATFSPEIPIKNPRLTALSVGLPVSRSPLGQNQNGILGQDKEVRLNITTLLLSLSYTQTNVIGSLYFRCFTTYCRIWILFRATSSDPDGSGPSTAI